MIIDTALLDKVCAEARASERLRMNLNLHESFDAKSQILINALEPGTELPIHRHNHTAETYVLLRGKIEVIFYNGDRTEKERFVLDVVRGNHGARIPAGQWHTIRVIAPDSVIFEVKDGPYIPLQEKDIL